jgi:primosomal protein N' (replication factor Y)
VDPDELENADGRAEDADIYVTTWIGTKPELRPSVSLVAVLDADALVRRPDFRSAESAYQALAAMAEWAGPAEQGGRLMVHTGDPTHHAIQAVARADYRYFFERELEQRRELGYPPFAELVRAVATGGRAGEVIERAVSAARSAGAQVLGPIRKPSTAKGTNPVEILIKSPDAEEVAGALRPVLASVTRGNSLRLDTDPH